MYEQDFQHSFESSFLDLKGYQKPINFLSLDLFHSLSLSLASCVILKEFLAQTILPEHNISIETKVQFSNSSKPSFRLESSTKIL